MNKQLYFTALIILAVILSAGVVCASDVSVTDSYATSLVDDTKDVSISNGSDAGSSEILASSVSNVDNDTSKVSLSSEEGLESENSNILSTNTNINSQEGIASYDDSDRLLSAVSGDVASENLTNGNTKLAASSAKTDMIITAVYDAVNNRVVATLTNGATGNVIQNAKVNVNLNGDTTIVKSNSKGQAVISTASLSYGSYKATISYPGNSKYNSASKSLKFTITKADMIISPVYDASNKEIVVTLTNNVTGKIIANANVKVLLNGVTSTIKSNGKGQAVISTSDLSYGIYKAVISYAGNAKYNSASTSIKFTAAKADMIISAVYDADNNNVVATLTSNATGKIIQNAAVNVNINGKTSSVKSNGNGQVKVSAADFPVGVNTVTISYDGSNEYYPASATVEVVIPVTVPDNATGYFVFGADMKNVNLNTLASNGVTDLFLNYYAIEKHGKSAVETWIASANKMGIRVHIWMQAFYDNGTWVNPVLNGSYNTEFSNYKIDEAQSYAKIKGLSGILLDYLRYPGEAYNTAGGTAAISKFTKLISDEIRKVNPALIVSATLMPETNTMAHDYGQNYSAISKYVDVVMPMIYKGNYGKSTSWIKSTAKWYVDRSKGAKVWTVLQSYNSDSDTTKLSESSLTTDIKNALSGGSDGVIIFRYGLTNLIDFNDLDSSSTSNGPATISIDAILTGASNLKTYYEKNGELPNTVTAADHAFTLPEFLYLMNQAIYQLNSSNTSAIKCIYGVGAPSSPSGDAIDTQLYRNDYSTVAKNVASFIQTNNVAPNYASSTAGKIMYSDLVDISSRILAFYKNNDKYLPNYVTIKTNGGTSSSSNSSSSGSSSSLATISVNAILTGASNLKTYYENNGVLPNTVTAAGHAFTLPEFLYLMSQATYQLNSSNMTEISCIYGVKAPSSPSGDTINEQLVKEDYLVLANNLATYIKTNNQAPNYASSAVGKISYNVLVDAFSRILAFYKNNDNYMPNYVTIIQGSASSASSSYTVGGMNVKNTITNLDAYYKSTTNCQVNNTVIKSLVDSLTSGLTSDKEKATVIYNYVRDQISYSFYYDTKYGALGTVTAKTGNCVDQAHLLIAMYRTAGLAARYEHGTCYFTLSGSTYGHVWTQVLIYNVWVVGDPTSTRNSFGNVVNWDTSSYTHKSYYASLPF